MIFLNSFGQWLPDRIVSNAELGEILGCTAEWIRSASGIEERRYATDTETVASMGAHAAQDCLRRASVDPGSIGYLICSSGSAERRFPGPAVEIADALGCGEIPALDVPVASAGSLVALDLARNLAARYGRVLVVASEKMSTVAMTKPLERGITMLFGDGAGACLVSGEPGPLEVVDSLIATDGKFANDLMLPLDGPLRMNGRSVILHASRKVPRAVEALLERNHLKPADITSFVMHQANLNLITKIAGGLGVEAKRFFANIARYGNTSSASLLIAASDWLETGGLRVGEHAVLTVFGAGFQWGAMLVRGSHS
ncbi:MAG: ketoacyl-ACP synthase III [Bryobacterales bacterium]|nr:ketoacyl-ACP synthase III [Bryobacterales bacterium]